MSRLDEQVTHSGGIHSHSAAGYHSDMVAVSKKNPPLFKNLCLIFTTGAFYEQHQNIIGAAIIKLFKPGNFKHKCPGTHVRHLAQTTEIRKRFRNKYFIDIRREFHLSLPGQVKE